MPDSENPKMNTPAESSSAVSKETKADAPQKSQSDALYPATIQIVFRGLMMFHNNKTPGEVRFEAGILDVPWHTFTITVLTRYERRKEETLLYKMKLEGREEWKFVLENPCGPAEVREYDGYTSEGDPDFDNTKFDFRWLADLESERFHANHHRPINRGFLNPVVTIPQGLVYTNLISKRLGRRKNNEDFKYFGYAAQEVGFDISLGDGGWAALDTCNDRLFTLHKNDNLRYRIEFENNAEPVQTSGAGHTAGNTASDSDFDDRVRRPRPEPDSENKDYSRYLVDHFHFFYDVLRINPQERYEFKLMEDEPYDEPRRPHPNPAICPQSMLGKTSIVG